MHPFVQDLRYAVRWLGKNRGFTAVALLTLALGIGANTAIFSFVNGVLLRPLPYREPDRLVQIWERVERQGRVQDAVVVSPPNFRDWQKRARSFAAMAAYSDWSFNLTGGAAPERVLSAIVSADFFRVLGTKPLVGRTFAADEDRPGHDLVAVISRKLWVRRFDGDPGVVGKALTLDGKTFTVIGVVDSTLRIPSVDPGVEVFAPLSHGFAEDNRSGHYLAVVARLAPGVSLAAARADMTSVAGALAREFPDSNTNFSASVIPSQEQMVGDVRPALYAMLGAVLLVLLIAAANVANMMLARASSREKEIAIRVALGADRSRILRQLLTESLLLAFAGGAVGVLLAFWGVDLLKALAPRDIPRLADVRVDGVVAVFAIALSVVTGALFGFAPAWHSSRSALAAALKDRGSRTTDRRTGGVRNALVVAEFALSLVLVVGSGLLLKSFLRLQDVRLGFDRTDTLTFALDLPETKYPRKADLVAFHDRLLERLKALPGVESAASVSGLPLTTDRSMNLSFLVEGRPRDRANVTTADLHLVSAEYFRLMRIPAVRGRVFTASDGPEAPRVAVINETMARTHFPGVDPIGRRVTLSDNPKPENWMTVAGIVADVHETSPASAPASQMYIAFPQRPEEGLVLLVRSARDRNSLLADIRTQVAALDPEQPIHTIRTLDEVVTASLGQQRFRTVLIGLFGLTALLLAAVGIYGVMAYSVSQRTQEIGVRMALGAAAADVLKLVFGQVLRLTGIAVVAGLAAALALSRLLASLLFGVTATDVATYGVVSLLLFAVAAVACWLPARRATRIDPTVALRQE